jgi:GNAT superfamily N-acetyltransferase
MAEIDFAQTLTQAYLAAPCQVLPNALWKTLARLENRDTVSAQSLSGRPIHLEIWRERRLLLYWDRARDRLDLTPEQIEQVRFALIHQDYLAALRPERFAQRTAFFRLKFTGTPMPFSLPYGFHFRGAAPDLEAEAISGLIGRCYEALQPGVEEVRGWTRQPVFAPSLWVWAWDELHDRPAGLGIAEFDPSINEGSLEWIQVLPEYRGRGLAQGLVLELLRRLHGRADFVTVSGEVDNLTNPEELYRKCGFTGADIWWVLS